MLGQILYIRSGIEKYYLPILVQLRKANIMFSSW